MTLSFGKKSLFVLFVTLVTAAQAEYAAPLKPDSLLDGWMYRLSTRYGIELPVSFYTQPMNALEVSAFFAVADSLDREGKLSAQEGFRLERFRNRMLGATTRVRWDRPQKDIHVQVHAEAQAQFRPRLQGGDGALDFNGSLIPSISGNTRNVSYASEADIMFIGGTDTMFYPDATPNPYEGLHKFIFGRADSGQFISSDIVRAGVRYHTPLVQVEGAIDRWRQGPSLFNPLAFSGQTPPFLYLRARLDMGSAWYTHSVGKLQSQRWTDKYIYAHRLEIAMRRLDATVSINETIINGTTTNEQDSLSENGLRREYYGKERNWSAIYFIPFIPYILAERYERDRDNLMMSIDFSKRLWDHSRVYVEFFIDDMTMIKGVPLFGDDWGNKVAFSGGHQFFGTLAGRDIETAVEYARIEPWVYTHFYGGAQRYTHFGQSLGAQIGPNADQVNLRALYGITPCQRIGLQFTNTRSNPTSRGGDVRHVFQDDTTRFMRDGEEVVVYPDSWTKTFLGEGTITATRVALLWFWEPRDFLTADLQGAVVAGKTPRMEGALSVKVRF